MTRRRIPWTLEVLRRPLSDLSDFQAHVLELEILCGYRGRWLLEDLW